MSEVKNLSVGKDIELCDLHVIDRVSVLTGTIDGGRERGRDTMSR